MGRWEVTGPDGSRYEIEAPDENALQEAVEHIYGGAPAGQTAAPQTSASKAAPGDLQNVARIKRNISKMIDAGAPEADIDRYLVEEGTTAEALRATPKLSEMPGALAKPEGQRLVPVDYDPFAPQRQQAPRGPTLIPVDYDPFAPTGSKAPSAPLAAFQPVNASPRPANAGSDPYWQVANERASEAAREDAQRKAMGLPAAGSRTTFADDHSGSSLEVAAQGVARGTGADMLGLPIDLATAGNNAARALLNIPSFVAGAATGKPRELPFGYISKPTGGSDWIAEQSAKLAEALGIKTADYDALGPREKAVYQMSRFGAGGFAQGLGLRHVAATRAPSETPRVFDEVLKPYSRESVAPTLARDTAAGAGVGAGLATADEVLPEDSRGPISSLIAGLIGGVGGANLADALSVGPKATFAWATAGRPEHGVTFNTDGSYVSRGAATDAARYVQEQAGGTDAARRASETIGERVAEFRDMGAPVPTTGQIAENTGLARVERGIRNTSSPATNPIFEQDRAVNTYAGEQVRGMGPEGADPNLYPQAAAEVAGRLRTPARAELSKAESGLEAIAGQREAEARSLTDGAATRKVEASQALDREITGDMSKLRAERATALDSRTIDPDGAVRIDATPIFDAADRARQAGVTLPDSFRKRLPVADELAGRRPHEVSKTSPILDASGAPIVSRETVGSPEMTLAELNDARPMLAQLSSTLEKSIGGGNTAAIPQKEAVDTLRAAINKELRSYSESAGTPEAQRLAQGLALGDEFSRRYREPGIGDPVVDLHRDMYRERGDLTGRTTTPPEQTAGRFIKEPERGGIQGMQSLNRVMAEATDPAAIANARRDFLISVAASEIVEGNKINPRRLGRFMDKWGTVIEHAPETKAEFARLLEKARLGQTLEDGFSQAIEGAKGRLKLTEAEIADSALATVIGATGRKGIQAVLGSKNPPAQMADLVKRLEKVPGGVDSVRRALSDYLADRVTNTNRQATLDGGLPPSYAKLVGLEKDPDLDRVLAAAWGDQPEAMQALQRARRVLEPREFLATVQGTAGSPTASNLSSLMRMLELGLRTTQGGLRGGNTARNIKVALGSLLDGRDSEVLKLVARAHVDPAVAQHLLSKQLAQDPVEWTSKMRRMLNWEEAARQANEED